LEKREKALLNRIAYPEDMKQLPVIQKFYEDFEGVKPTADDDDSELPKFEDLIGDRTINREDYKDALVTKEDSSKFNL
jgi:hypothetical protein